MAGLSYTKRNEFQVQQNFIQSLFSGLNTTLFGTISSVQGDKATINITNTITTQDQFGSLNSAPYTPVKTNFATLSLYQYTPSAGDTVMLMVSQSNIQPILSGNNSPSLAKFNLYDSIIFPIKLGYTDTTTVTAGILSKNFNINCTKFSVNNSTNELISALLETLNLIQSTTVGGVPLDNATAIATAIAKINTFLV